MMMKIPANLIFKVKTKKNLFDKFFHFRSINIDLRKKYFLQKLKRIKRSIFHVPHIFALNHKTIKNHNNHGCLRLSQPLCKMGGTWKIDLFIRYNFCRKCFFPRLIFNDRKWKNFFKTFFLVLTMKIKWGVSWKLDTLPIDNCNLNGFWQFIFLKISFFSKNNGLGQKCVEH